MSAVGQNPDSIASSAEEEFANEEFRKDGNLYFDQSLFKGKKQNCKKEKEKKQNKLKKKIKMRKSERVDSIASESSVDSDLSDDAFLN